MSRRRIKRNRHPRSKARKHERPNKQWVNPKMEYIYSDEQPILEVLVKRWKHNKGWDRSSMSKKCMKEGWARSRQDWTDKMERRVMARMEEEGADRRYEQIRTANERHVKMGQSMQGMANVLMQGLAKEAKKHKGKLTMDEDKAYKIVAQMVPKGVDVERKGLGLVDKFVTTKRIEILGGEFIDIIKKFVVDPDIYSNIKSEIRALVVREKKDLDEIIDVDYEEEK